MHLWSRGPAVPLQFSRMQTSGAVNTAAPLLEVQQLKVDYMTERGPVRAVDNVSFSIAPGEVLGLAGESGSGKSTIAHAIMRVLHEPAIIAGGGVRFRDRDVLAMHEEELESFRWRDISMVFQSAMNALNPVMTIGDQIIDTIQAHVPATKKRSARPRRAPAYSGRHRYDPARFLSAPALGRHAATRRDRHRAGAGSAADDHG